MYEFDKKITGLQDMVKPGGSPSSLLTRWESYIWGSQSRISDSTQKLGTGTLIEVAFHTSNNSPNTHLLNPNEVPTVCGPVHTKRRTVMVVGLFAEHADCVPIYSHNNTGLRNKARDEREEFVAIRKKSDRWDSENGHMPLEVIPSRSLYSDGLLNRKSYVKFTERMSHRYITWCSIKGGLDDESIERLRARYGEVPEPGSGSFCEMRQGTYGVVTSDTARKRMSEASQRTGRAYGSWRNGAARWRCCSCRYSGRAVLAIGFIEPITNELELNPSSATHVTA